MFVPMPKLSPSMTEGIVSKWHKVSVPPALAMPDMAHTSLQTHDRSYDSRPGFAPATTLSPKSLEGLLRLGVH